MILLSPRSTCYANTTNPNDSMISSFFLGGETQSLNGNSALSTSVVKLRSLWTGNLLKESLDVSDLWGAVWFFSGTCILTCSLLVVLYRGACLVGMLAFALVSSQRPSTSWLVIVLLSQDRRDKKIRDLIMNYTVKTHLIKSDCTLYHIYKWQLRNLELEKIFLTHLWFISVHMQTVFLVRYQFYFLK